MRALHPQVAERNYAREPLGEAEVLALLRLVPVAEVLNTRHAVARERGWKESPPSAEEFAAAVARENNLLRRPVLVRGDRVVVGRDEAAIRALLGG